MNQPSGGDHGATDTPNAGSEPAKDAVLMSLEHFNAIVDALPASPTVAALASLPLGRKKRTKEPNFVIEYNAHPFRQVNNKPKPQSREQAWNPVERVSDFQSVASVANQLLGASLNAAG